MKKKKIPKQELTPIDLMKIAKDYTIVEKLNDIMEILAMQDELNVIVRNAYDKLEKRVKKLERLEK